MALLTGIYKFGQEILTASSPMTTERPFLPFQPVVTRLARGIFIRIRLKMKWNVIEYHHVASRIEVKSGVRKRQWLQ